MRRAMAVLVTATTIGAAGFGLSPAGAQVVDAMAATPSAAAVGDEVVLSGSISCPGQEPGSAVMVSFFDPDEGPQTRAGLGDAPLGADGSFTRTFTVPAEMQQLLIGQGVATMPVVAKGYEIHASCSFSEGHPTTIRIPFTVTEAPAATTTTTTTTPPTTAPPTTAAPTTTAPPAGFTPPATPPGDATPMTSPPAPGAAGGTLAIAEGGFIAGEAVPVVLYSTPTVLATLTADGTGTVRGTVTIPAGTTAGAHTLVLYGEAMVKAATITVQAATQPAAQALPRTGTDDWLPWMLLVAATSLLTGAHLIGQSRRLATVERQRG